MLKNILIKKSLLLISCLFISTSFVACKQTTPEKAPETEQSSAPEQSKTPEESSVPEESSTPEQSGVPEDKSADSEEKPQVIEVDTTVVSPQMSEVKNGEEIVVMTTNKGVIKLRLFPEVAPKTVENFVTHVKDGYYDGLIFHRVIDNFMIQGGDPTGTGTGGESIWKAPFEDEVSPALHNIRGALSMANAGANTNGSQFFIVQKPTLEEGEKKELEYMKENPGEVVGDDGLGGAIAINEVFPHDVVLKYLEVGGCPTLDYKHTVFGQVIEGMDVVDAIAKVKTTEPGTKDKPVEDVIIESAVVEKYKK